MSPSSHSTLIEAEKRFLERERFLPTMSKSQKYKGVRQRHWGSWVSEIRHPSLKIRIWLGTFETAEEAARAYDEAARLMSEPRARTNFPLDPNSSSSSSFTASIAAKLQRRCLASMQKQQPQGDRAMNMQILGGGQEEGQEEQYECLDEEHIDQMIEELIYYGSMEISPYSNSAAF